MSPKTGTADLQIASATDGQVFGTGKTIPLLDRRNAGGRKPLAQPHHGRGE
jgi:hypothetical protein